MAMQRAGYSYVPCLWLLLSHVPVTWSLRLRVGCVTTSLILVMGEGARGILLYVLFWGMIFVVIPCLSLLFMVCFHPTYLH